LAGPQTQIPQNGNPAVETYAEPEAYAVYGALLPSNRVWGGWFTKSDSLIIQQETEGDRRRPECFPSLTGPREAWAEALADYKKENQTPRLFVRAFPIEKPYVLVPKLRIGDSFKAKGWDSFYDRYPQSGGLIHLSAVGFNADKTKALVYIAHYCGSLCGIESYVYLEKQGGKWVATTLGDPTCGMIF
jgi:hypothetical protein